MPTDYFGFEQITLKVTLGKTNQRATGSLRSMRVGFDLVQRHPDIAEDFGQLACANT